MARKSVLKILFIIVGIAAVVIIVGLLIKGDGTFTFVSNDISKYEKMLEEEDTQMPKLDSLGNYESIEFWNVYKTVLMFNSEAWVLKVKYNEKDYQMAKEELKSKYVFQINAIVQTEGFIIPSEFVMDGYHMRFLDEDGGFNNFPKQIMTVGTFDETREILYCYFLDTDLDYVDEPINEFLAEQCLIKK